MLWKICHTNLVFIAWNSIIYRNLINFDWKLNLIMSEIIIHNGLQSIVEIFPIKIKISRNNLFETYFLSENFGMGTKNLK